MRFLILCSLLLTVFHILYAEQEKIKSAFIPPKIPDNSYLALFIEPNDLGSKFVVSKSKKEQDGGSSIEYDGVWKVDVPESSSLLGDYALILTTKAKHHAVATKLNKELDFTSKEIVIQYEVKFENSHDCGGAYIKLLSSHAADNLEKFNDKTPFTIMFGPDKCGNEAKVHFIFRHRNPVTNKYEEKHLKSPFRPDRHFTDKLTHLYTLVLRDDNSFEILVDETSVKSGSLLDDFEPPVNPPAEVPDANEVKPADWDDRAKITDPSAKKPDDWDEEAPEFIPDNSVEKPEGWMDKEPLMIQDPDAKKPEDWDVEIDGEWEAPKIENPKCKEGPGCGEWKRPQIKNPGYKGKWVAPIIDNPSYMGEWKPKMIPNPEFFEDSKPYKMNPVSALGLELWTMSDGVVFDNFLITDSKTKADEWTKETWSIKHAAELASNPSAQSVVDFVKEQYNQSPVIVLGITFSIVFLLGICIWLCFRSSKVDLDESGLKKKNDDLQDENSNENMYQAAGPKADKKSPSKEDIAAKEDMANGDVEVEQIPEQNVKKRSRKD